MPGDTSDIARMAVRALTTEQRDDLFRLALSVLPSGHPLRSRIDELHHKRHAGDDDSGADSGAEIYEAAVEVWREIEARKEVARLESVRKIEEYRSTWVAKRDDFLALGLVVNDELDEIQKAFAGAHQHHPSFCAWVYIDGSARPEGPGSLQFQELANRAAQSFSGTRGDYSWKDWLAVLVAYLLETDLNEEHLEKFPAGRRIRSTSEPDHDGMFEGENYRIRAAFKASEHCCSWLARLGMRGHAGSTARADKTLHARPRRNGFAGNSKRTLTARAWEDIKVYFLSDERVQITVGTETETRNYEEMGFASKKGGKPVLAWETLRALSATAGVVMIASDSRKWAEVEKRIQEIRRVFRGFFGVAGDPIPYIKRTRRNQHEFGYRTKFEVGRRPSYES